MTEPPDVLEMHRVADRPAALAVALARRGVTFVVVGSTAERLVTGRGLPADLDIRVSRQAVPALVQAVIEIFGPPATRERPLSQDYSRFVTWLGTIDVFVDDTPGPRTEVVADGTRLWVTTSLHPVAARADPPDRRSA